MIIFSLAAVQRYLSFLYLSFLILRPRRLHILWVLPPSTGAATFTHTCVRLRVFVCALCVCFMCVLYVCVGAIPIVRLPPLVGGLYVFVYMFSRAHIHTFRDPAGPPQQFPGILRD